MRSEDARTGRVGTFCFHACLGMPGTCRVRDVLQPMSPSNDGTMVLTVLTGLYVLQG
jgi:hypothetical protein